MASEHKPAQIGSSSGGNPLGNLRPKDPDNIGEEDTAAVSTQTEHSQAPNNDGAPPPQARDSADVTLPPGHRLGQYELIRPLGAGGMGAVYLGRDLRLGRLVAIKILSKSTPAVRERFLIEARATARCSHENIVVIHEVGEYEDHPYLVLEFIEGQTLRRWWLANTEAVADAASRTSVSNDELPHGNEARTPLAARRVVELMVPVMRALVCAHAHGIVHRDLKQDNIMLTHSGTTKVLDFGIAKQLSDRTPVRVDTLPSQLATASLTVTGGLVGTLPYMSPEQLAGDHVDHRSDLWAVGIMMFELAVGRHPLDQTLHRNREALAATLNLDEPMPSASEAVPGLGPLGDIIDRCLIKDRTDRIDSARILLDELEALLPTRAALDHTSSPFGGLAPFQSHDADRFFGRDRDIAALQARVRGQPLVAVVGASGAGKSSLVRAGLIPALQRSGEGWSAHILRPGRTPMSVLADLLVSLSSALDDTDTPDSLLSPQPSQDLRTSLKPLLRAQPGRFGAAIRTWARRKRRRVVIFIDQFEELYTLGAPPELRAAFTACLDSAADDPSAPVRVVIALRADFFDRVAEDRNFMDQASRGIYVVTPLEREGLFEALCRPVEAADHSFEDPAMVEEMLNALEGNAAALPLLQFAADSLWSRRDSKRRLLTRAGYQAMGGVAGALAVHADNVLAAMTQAERTLARTVLIRLVTPEQTQAPAELAELRQLHSDPDAISAVISHLVEARLLAVEAGSEENSELSGDTEDAGEMRIVELVHESLISGWPTLRRWLNETREDRAFLARLRLAAQQWDDNGRPRGLLWRGKPAREAFLWQARHDSVLTMREHAFLQASLACDEQERAEKARAQAEAAALRHNLEQAERERNAQSAEAWALALRTVEMHKILSLTSHGLMNSMHQIASLADFLSYEFDKGDSGHFDAEDSKQLLHDLLHASEAATDLLINFRTWRWLQSGRMVPSQENKDLHSQVQRVFVLLDNSARRKHLTMVNNIDPAVAMYADPDMVGTILRQLIGNAIKFTPANGTITVSSSTVSGADAAQSARDAGAAWAADGQFPDDQSMVRISVQDTGVGLYPADLEKIYSTETFHTTLGTAGEKGAGLGLALCYEMALLNGGFIEVESEPNQGSTFTLVLPAGPTEAPADS